MSADFPESDWRQFKEVHGKLQEQYCLRVLEEVRAATEDADGSAYDRYLRICKLIRERDKDMARAFDDFRRSTAVMQLGIMRRMQLLTDDDLRRFSELTQTRVEGIASLY
jgi:hypothetical protein